MLKSIVVSLLCAFPSAIFLTGLGALLNYYSFEKREELLFYKTIILCFRALYRRDLQIAETG